MTSAAVYAATAFAEIAGCSAFWAWPRLGRSALRTTHGLVAVIVAAVLLTRIDSGFAGRTYAAYGGVYITASLAWLWVIEAQRPDRWNLFGATLCLIGAGIILFGP